MANRNGAGSITVYAPDAIGNALPARTVSGPNTGLFVPCGVALDSAGNIYVANSDSITVYTPNASGNVAPVRTIRGNNTGLQGPLLISVR